MNFVTLSIIILSSAYYLPTFPAHLCKKRPNQPLEAEVAEQRKKMRRDALSCPDEFEKQLLNRYSKKQCALLQQLKAPCSRKSWPEKKKAITFALAQSIHPDDIILVSDIYNNFSNRNEKPLTCAVGLNDLPFAQKLLRHDADPNMDDADINPSPILFQASSPEMAQLLIAYRADVSCTCPYTHETLLHASNWRPQLTSELALLFFNAGVKASTIALFPSNSSTLLAAICSDENRLLSIMVRLGSPLDAKSTASWSRDKNYREIIERLIERAANNEDGWVKQEDIPKYQARLYAIENARQEVEMARKERSEHVHRTLIFNGIDRDSGSIIVEYSQEHTLPNSVRQELYENALRYPCEIDKLPNYDQEPEEMVDDQQPSFFSRLLGF